MRSCARAHLRCRILSACSRDACERLRMDHRVACAPAMLPTPARNGSRVCIRAGKDVRPGAASCFGSLNSRWSVVADLRTGELPNTIVISSGSAPVFEEQEQGDLALSLQVRAIAHE